MSTLTAEEREQVGRMMSRHHGDGNFYPDRHTIARVLETLEVEHGIDLSSLRPDPAERYIVEQRTPPHDGMPYWLVHDLWTGEPVMSVSAALPDAEDLAHATAERMNEA